VCGVVAQKEKTVLWQSGELVADAVGLDEVNVAVSVVAIVGRFGETPSFHDPAFAAANALQFSECGCRSRLRAWHLIIVLLKCALETAKPPPLHNEHCHG
jgi:hypothetical protein